MDLLHADTEEDVIKVLKNAGYWDDPSIWRDYGDLEGNFATIGNQQSRPEAALVEKIVNSVDARLMNACFEAGIDPASGQAPPDIWAAVNQFFPGSGGSLRDWASAARRTEAANITLAATGLKRRPCITIADRGEGQTPAKVPDTFMSLTRSNKLRIPFVQGKFNMGGTGVLKFCGEHRLQLLITKRNPSILTQAEKADPDASCWSVTMTRRQRPQEGVGQVRNSVFTYLAPLGADEKPGGGGVLRFSAQSLPLMPQYDQPYSREIEYGSVVKLYNYDMKGFTSHILMKGELLYRLEALLPEIALPVNLHECRDFAGVKEKSFVTPLAGLIVRLDEGKGGNIEEGFPDSVPFRVRTERMVAKIYAFKDGRASTYTTNEGVIFSINGQTHGVLPKSLFSRNKVRLGRLSDSLLVMVDCSEISVDAREDLFMNSRDRLSQHELRKDIEAEIEEILSRHPKLKQLANTRAEREIGKRLADSKPLEQVLNSILKSSPTLAALFRAGQRLGNPFSRKHGEQEDSKNGKSRGGGGGREPGDQPFVGKKHPTYFRFHQKRDGEMLERNCEVGRRCRVTLETDVENEYFMRTSNRGWYEVEAVETTEGKHEGLNPQNSMLLHDGLAHWSIVLPEDIEVGEALTLQLTVGDDTLNDSFINIARLTVKPQSEHPHGSSGKRRSSTMGGGSDQPAGIEMPRVVEVKEGDWPTYGFEKTSACKIIQENDGSYTFYINIDNLYLRHEMKYSKDDPSLLEAKFKYGNVLVGLALIQDDRQTGKTPNASEERAEAGSAGRIPVESRVLDTTRALGPFMVPMINYLGSLSREDIVTTATAGDEE
jgi:hypothetical protein